MTKNVLRKDILKKRSQMEYGYVQELSTKIQDSLLQSDLWPQTGRVGLYASIKNEVFTFRLFQYSLEQGLHVYFPRVEQGIAFYEVNGPEDLRRGAWGIPEPNKNCRHIPADESLDLLVVPGVAFTKEGCRLGYGQGFYDRYLEDKKLITVGLAYEFQLVPELPCDEWDKKLDAIITEKHIYKNDKDHE